MKPKCDFCSGFNIAWVYPAASFQFIPGIGSEGDWAACEPCAEIIETGDPVSLARHVARLYVEYHELGSADAVEVMAAALEDLHREFFAHRKGERLTYEPV